LTGARAFPMPAVSGADIRMDDSEAQRRLERFIQRSFLAAWGFFAVGLLLIVIGFATGPLVGWAAGYVAGVGMLLSVATVVPVVVNVVAAVLLRLKFGRWYFGASELPHRTESED
jgi:hypothetical protein